MFNRIPICGRRVPPHPTLEDYDAGLPEDSKWGDFPSIHMVEGYPFQARVKKIDVLEAVNQEMKPATRPPRRNRKWKKKRRAVQAAPKVTRVKKHKAYEPTAIPLQQPRPHCQQAKTTKEPKTMRATHTTYDLFIAMNIIFLLFIVDLYLTSLLLALVRQ